jgi:hypothetical protein
MERKDFRQKNNDSKSTRGFGDSSKPRSEKSGFKRSSPSRSSSDRFSDRSERSTERSFGARKSFGARDTRDSRPDRSDRSSKFDRPTREAKARTGNTSFRNFEDLEVFKKAYNLSLEIHNFFVNNDSKNTDDVAVMLKSLSKNVCTCIAGFANKGDENSIESAISLCDVIKVWLKYALDLEYIDFKNWDLWRNSYVEVAKMLIGLANSKG